ncbi:MAG: helix-turn-helix transcriptional regulator [Lachnospiraceae bacterium]|nr:helix-turn-helix transcriptional regulator [Lachnospiraceae bacterium]
MKEKSIGKRIGHLCKKKGMTPYQLATRATVPMTTLDNIIKGHTTNPGIYTVNKICGGLGMTLQEFLDCEEFGGGEDSGKDSK